MTFPVCCVNRQDISYWIGLLAYCLGSFRMVGVRGGGGGKEFSQVNSI